jgi:hypothetical protein
MTQDADTAAACTICGDQHLEAGFIEDTGQSAMGYARWIQGSLQRGIFGGAKRLGRLRREIRAFRCQQCGHLELFTGEVV